MLNCEVDEFTRPMNSSISLGLFPAAATRVGFAIKVGVVMRRIIPPLRFARIERSQMSKNEIDSTVLLLAVIAGIAALLLIPPGQAWLCGAAGLILLITLFAFDLEGARSVLQSFA